MKRISIAVALVALSALATCPSQAQDTNSTINDPKTVAHLGVLKERATKIVSPLGITDDARSERVRDIIIRQYRDLSGIHEVRDKKIKQARETAGADKASTNAEIEAARAEAKPKLDKLHGEFLGRLATELSPEQVEKVKDGMTYGVLPLTYGVYLRMYPELTEEQKTQIKAWLTEAREQAMDGSTSDEKHAVFGKYKGKINNYLSKAGYDAKKAEQNLKKPSPPASAESKPK
jgi:Spy/CpxP family protein refolding chaperone